MADEGCVIIRTPRRRSHRVAAAVAAFVVGASTGMGALAGTSTASAQPGAAAAAVVPGAAASAPAAGRISAIPSTCRAAVTLVRPDRSLAVGVVQGTTAQIHPAGVRLAFTPRTIAYLGTSRSTGLTIDRYFAIAPTGRLHRITVAERPSDTPRVRLTDTVVAGGWGGIRTLVSSGPYLYGITTAGGLKRYLVTKDFGVRGSGTLATSGWRGVTSLSFGGWWNTGRNRVSEDIVGLASNGSVTAYVVPRSAPLRVTSRRLVTGGWQMFSHVAVGECSTGNARPVLAVKPNGDAHVYYDTNGNDQSWRDLRIGPRVARGWTGLVSD